MSSCDRHAILILALFSILGLFTTSQSSPCREALKRNDTATCRVLPTLGAEFGWNFTNNKSQIDIYFTAKLDAEMGWVAWGLNPGERPQMVGTRALIGIRYPNGTLSIDKYNITADTKLGCHLQPSNIDVVVRKMRPEYSSETGYFTIYATLVLPMEYNMSKLHHVWQVGYNVEGVVPRKHPTTLQNVDSTDTINLWTRKSQSIGKHRHHLRMVHGILNIVGWGTLMPMGAIIARYFRKFPIEYTWWFFLHVSCQIAGYTLGTTGWAIGLWLGHASKHYTFRTHRVLAIFIFTFTTLQMFALRLKPGRSDEYRKYWNMYHHFLGYALIAVMSANIFQGISILRPQNHTWKWAYIGLLGLLLCITLAFEIYTWIKFVNSRKLKKDRPPEGPTDKSQEGPTDKSQEGPTTAPNSSQPQNKK